MNEHTLSNEELADAIQMTLDSCLGVLPSGTRIEDTKVGLCMLEHLQALTKTQADRACA